MNAHILLCDHAVVENGKLYINGGGISQMRGSSPPSFWVAALIQIPWDRSGASTAFRFDLVDADGHAVLANDRPVEFSGQVELGRRRDLPPGIPLDFPLAFPVTLDLPSGRYTWRLTIDGNTHEHWHAAFTVTR